jgi:hypothetical protein
MNELCRSLSGQMHGAVPNLVSADDTISVICFSLLVAFSRDMSSKRYGSPTSLSRKKWTKRSRFQVVFTTRQERIRMSQPYTTVASGGNGSRLDPIAKWFDLGDHLKLRLSISSSRRVALVCSVGIVIVGSRYGENSATSGQGSRNILTLS